MEKYTIKNGQTALDIAVEKYGDLNKLTEVISQVDTVVGLQPVNVEIQLDNIDPNEVTFFFEQKRPIATFKNDY